MAGVTWGWSAPALVTGRSLTEVAQAPYTGPLAASVGDEGVTLEGLGLSDTP